MTVPNNPTPDLVTWKRFEVQIIEHPYSSSEVRWVETANGSYVLHSEAAATIARLTAERDGLEARLISCDANLTHTLKEYTEMTLQRDRANRSNKLLSERIATKDEALAKAEQFIVNGIELGFISMPEYQDNPAHETLPAIRRARSLSEGK